MSWHFPAASCRATSGQSDAFAGVVGTLPTGGTNDLQAALSVGYATSLRAQANNVDAVSLDGLLLTAEVGLGF